MWYISRCIIMTRLVSNYHCIWLQQPCACVLYNCPPLVCATEAILCPSRQLVAIFCNESIFTLSSRVLSLCSYQGYYNVTKENDSRRFGLVANDFVRHPSLSFLVQKLEITQINYFICVTRHKPVIALSYFTRYIFVFYTKKCKTIMGSYLITWSHSIVCECWVFPHTHSVFL